MKMRKDRTPLKICWARSLLNSRESEAKPKKQNQTKKPSLIKISKKLKLRPRKLKMTLKECSISLTRATGTFLISMILMLSWMRWSEHS